MKRAPFLVVILLGLVGIVTPALAAPADPFETFGLVSLDGGVRAPAFSLSDLNGASVGVPGGGGEAAILIFWATW
ncbi:MAG: hypothetical protein HY728_10825 [Candidatus Rokubacteria bacterium]|nr:hypothetical protein [Candidatus Rokubacteria bacterium]